MGRSRARSIHAHQYSPDEDLPPPLPDVPRPIISTKYKSTNRVNSPTPPPSNSPHLRRAQTESAVLPPRPASNGHAKRRKIMKVEYPFDAESDSEMSIAVGEMIAVIEEVDS